MQEKVQTDFIILSDAFPTILVKQPLLYDPITLAIFSDCSEACLGMIEYLEGCDGNDLRENYPKTKVMWQR